MFSDVPLIARNWWLFVLAGLICLAAALAIVVWPDITLLVLGIVIGAYLLLAAALEIVDAVLGDPGGRATSAILGVVALVAGIICIRRPGESLLAVIVAIGIYLVVAGVIRAVRAFGVHGGRGWALLVAAVDVVVGCLLLAWPDLGLVAVGIMVAASMAIRGAWAVFVGLKLRGLRGEEEPPQVRAGLAT